MPTTSLSVSPSLLTPADIGVLVQPYSPNTVSASVGASGAVLTSSPTGDISNFSSASGQPLTLSAAQGNVNLVPSSNGVVTALGNLTITMAGGATPRVAPVVGDALLWLKANGGGNFNYAAVISIDQPVSQAQFAAVNDAGNYAIFACAGSSYTSEPFAQIYSDGSIGVFPNQALAATFSTTGLSLTGSIQTAQGIAYDFGAVTPCGTPPTPGQNQQAKLVIGGTTYYAALSPTPF